MPREPAAGQMLARTGLSALTRPEIENIDRLLPYLSYSGGRLVVGETPATDLWDGARSLLLYLPERAVDNYRSIQAAFARHFDVSVCCAVKTCYLPGMLSAVRAAGAGAEIASDLEWRIARRLGFPPERTVANGVGRSAHHLECLLGEETTLIGIDGEEDLERSEWHAQRLGVKPNIMIRVNPLPPDAFFSERSKLGTEWHAAYRLLERAAGSPHLGLRGLHAHQLARCAEPEQFARLARQMGELASAFATAGGTHLDVIDLGGGLESRFLLDRAGQPIEAFAAAARDALAGVPGGFHLLLEPGRFIFGDAALVLTGVREVRRKAGADWLITDVGCNILPPTSDRAYPPLPLHLTAGQDWQRCHVADPTPQPSRLYLDALLPGDAPRHGLALIGCGAYTAVRASLWGTDLPDIALFRGGRAEIVFGRPDQDAAMRSLYGIDLSGIG
jgi:diaminopimelate decarboxylase